MSHTEQEHSPNATRGPAKLAALLCGLAALLCGLAAVPASAAVVTHNFLFSFDGSGTPAGTFGPPREGSPNGVAVDNSLSASAGDVWVNDPQHHVVDKFSPAGAYICQITGKGSATTSPSECDGTDPGAPGGSFNFQTGLATDPSSGSLVAPDSAADLVDSFAPTGAYLSQFSLSNNARPYGLAVGATGDIYVTAVASHLVDKFDPATETLTTFATATPAGPFGAVYGVAVDNDPSSPAYGDVYVAEDETADTHIGRYAIDVFDSSGTFLRSISGTPAGSFSLLSEPRDVAVDPSNGHVYVSANQTLDEFDPAGNFVTSIGPEDAPSGSWFLGQVAISATNGRLYVGDQKNNLVDVFTPDVVPPEIVTEPAAPVTPTSATLRGTVNPVGAEVTDCHFEYGTDTSYGHSVPCAETVGSGSSPVPVHAEITGLTAGTTYHYRLAAANAEAHEVAEDQVFGPPLIRRSSADGIEPAAATLHAVLNPDGVEITDCHFEYGTDASYGHSVPCAQAAGSGSADVPVSADIGGLTAGTTYHFRLVVASSAAAVDGPDQTFAALPPALLDLQPPTAVTSTAATLNVYLDPNGADVTDCHFEYGTDASYGHGVPCAETAGSGTSPVAVHADIGGLEPDTTYHFRTVATNVFGTATGPDSTFATPPASCPNEALRREDNSLGLPECRAYERVSPADKAGYAAISPMVSFSGDRVGYQSLGVFAGATGSANTSFYLAQREPAGWASAGINPPAGLGLEAGLTGTLWPSADLSSFVNQLMLAPNAGTAHWAAQSAALFIRRPDGSFAQASPAFGYQDGSTLDVQVFINGVSADLSHVVIESGRALLPSDTAPEGARLYEVAGAGGAAPTLRAASVDSGGEVYVACGTGNGVDHRLSADGSKLFFTIWARGLSGGCQSEGGKEALDRQLLVRIDGQSTLNLSEPQPNDECTSAACTSAPRSSAFLEGISADGSRAFFLDARQLTDAASEDPVEADGAGIGQGINCTHGPAGPNGCNLYEYDFGRPAGHNLLALSAGDTSGLGPEVRGVVRVSPDGSHVYFVAGGVLASAPNALGQTAQAGADNLYVADAETGAVSFVAELCSGTERSGALTGVTRCPGSGSDQSALFEGNSARSDVTPDGRFFVFTTYAQLTPDDQNQAADVYRYDAQTASLVRVSVGHDGEDQNGNGGGQDAAVERPGLQDEASELRAISDDGQTVLFYTSRPLQSTDLNGLVNAYEWHQGEVTLVSGGRSTTSLNTGAGHAATLSASGRDIVFTSSQALVPWDTDGLDDVYDARVEGGFPEPPQGEPPCESGERCHGEGTHEPPPPLQGSASLEHGREEPEKPRCRKGFVLRRGKCVRARKHHRRRAHHRRAGADKGGKK